MDPKQSPTRLPKLHWRQFVRAADTENHLYRDTPFLAITSYPSLAPQTWSIILTCAMASQLPHSTDWLSTKLPGLSDLEATFRCHVCKDFYQTPMLTECSHTFCSICIRRALSNDGKCPACRSPQQESKLRSSISLGEAIEVFVRVRPAVLEIACSREGQSENARSPKRRTVPDTEPPNKRLRTSARLTDLRNPHMKEETRAVDQSRLGSDNVDGTFPGNEDHEERFRHSGLNKSYTPSMKPESFIFLGIEHLLTVGTRQ